MNARFLVWVVLFSPFVAAFRVDATNIYGLPVDINYTASATGYGSVTQAVVITAGLQDFTALGPDSSPLFDVSVQSNQISISALRTFTIPDNSQMDFNWVFSIAGSTGVSLGSATLLSSTLFSIPPYTSNINPPVIFDPTTGSISVGGPIADGVGNGTVNNGSVAVIDFTTIPEPATWQLLATSLGVAALSTRLRLRTKRPVRQTRG